MTDIYQLQHTRYLKLRRSLEKKCAYSEIRHFENARYASQQDAG